MKTNEVSFAKNIKKTLNPNNSLGRHSGGNRNDVVFANGPSGLNNAMACGLAMTAASRLCGEAKPTKQSRNSFRRFLSALGLTVAFLAAPSAYASIAGHVQFVSGNVQITSPTGQIRPAQKGDAINEGDTLTSAQKSSVQVKMQDGGFVAVRPETQLKFDQFVFAGKEDGSEKSFFSLFKGGFRAVTGLIGRINKQNYKITTPAATIGIRGTDHETFLITPDSPLAQVAPPGAYNKVNVGETYVATEKGTIFVLPNQMGYAGGMDQMPRVQPVNTNIFTVAEAATPEAKAEKKEEKEEKAEAKQEKVARSDKEEKKEEAKAEEAEAETTPATATQEEAAPVRETAVVDATAPATGTEPPRTPVITPPATNFFLPPAPWERVLPCYDTGGNVIDCATVATGGAAATPNFVENTITPPGGEPVSVTQGLYATQAQAAAAAAVTAANAAAAAATAAQTANTTLAALVPVDTAPAATAIATASPLVTGAATTYATAAAITPVATATESTAVATATTNVNAANTAVTAANALAPVATTPADTAIATANTNIGTANTAVATASGLAPVATAPAGAAIVTANTNIGTASPAVTAATALTPVDAATATANATAAQAAATVAAAQAAAAQAALTTNGVFADATAAPALAAAQVADAALQTANTAVQGAATAVSTNNTNLTAAQTAAITAFAAAQVNLNTATNNLATATTQNTALTAAQTAAQNALTTAQANLATANSNLATATTQNTALTAAQTAAQNALTTAQANLATANGNLTTATTQNAALTAAQAAAQTALTAAQNSLATANTNLTAASAQNITIANAQLAAPAQLTAAQTAAAAAQTAAAAAQAAAAQANTLQAAGDLAGAQAQLVIAQQQLAIAQQQQAAATAAQTAATTALASAQTALTTGQTSVTNAVNAATAAQTSASTVTTQAALVAPAATAASTAITAVVPAANTAIADAGTASTQAADAQTAAATATTAVTTATTAANTAATDAATAQTQAGAAQTAETTAATAVTTAATAANTAATDATTAQTQAAAAETASTNATAALAASNTNLATVNSNATVVATNAPIAAYNNPAVATPNRFIGALKTVVAPTAGQYIEGGGPGAAFTGLGTANTSFVLDGAGNLVESRHTWYEESAASTATTQLVVPDANVKRTGGTAAETFKLTDNSIYAGRWEGGSLTVTDNAAAVPQFTRNLGVTSEHWAIMLAPTAGYVQALTGTTAYTLAGATSPTDALGNVGVLNTATLSANFTSQVVSAALNLTIAAKTLDVVAANMAINGPGFSTGTQVTAGCTGCGAATYYAYVGGLFAGDAAASAGLSYTLWTGAAPGATTGATDLIQGLAAFTATTPPTLQAFDVAAQAAADAALAAANAAAAAANAAQTADTQLAGIAQVSAATAASNAAAAQAAADTAAAQSTAAQSALTANGAFADATAGTANTATQDANTVLQSANTTVQAAPGIVTTQNSAIVTAQGSGATSLTAAQTAANNAQTAATAAQAAAAQAATLQAGGDLAGAQAQLVIAQQQLAIAQTEQTNAQNAQAAVDSQLANAQAAATSAATALAQTDPAVVSPTPSPANIVQTNAPVVASNAPIAAYNNPAVVGDFIAAAMFPVAVAGGFNEAFSPSNPLQPNTMYVLDGSGNLVEARNLPFQVQANQNGTVLTPIITGASGADIKWNGGTASDTFKLPDNSLYAGRWMNATVTVTDNATPTNVYTYTPVASLWAVLLPPPAGYVPSLVGSATYTVAGNTTPVDAFGNLGILDSATLFADFTSQVVDAAIQLTMSAGSMAGTFNVSGTALPIDPAGGFGVPNATFLTTTCTVGTCAAGLTGYSADMGGSFAGTGAASVGMSYNIWPTTTISADPATNSIQGLVAFTADATPSGPTYPPAGTLASFGRIPVGSAGAWERGRFNVGSMPQTNTNFVLDASGNLVRALRVQYNERPTWGGIAPVTNNYADATVSYSGGVANDFYSIPDGSVTIGRWTGGQMTIADNLGVLSPLVKNLGTTSSHWVYWTPPATGFVQTLVGTTTYTKVGATLPTDTFGNVGTMPVATLSADFTNQTIDANIAFSIASQNLTVTATGVPIEAGGDFADAMLELGTAPSVTCTGTCAAGYLGNMTANIAGPAAMSADIHYSVWPTASQGSLVSDIIQGVVVFSAGTVPSVATNPAAGNWNSFGHMLVGSTAAGWQRGRFNTGANPGQPNTNFILDGAGNLVRSLHVQYNDRYLWYAASPATNQYADATVTYSGGTASDHFTDGSVAIGRWTGGQMTIADNATASPLPTLVNNLGVTSSYWFMTTPVPVNYVQSLVGTTTYTQAGATLPTNSLGNVGTAPTATLVADFTNQTVAASVAFTIASQNLNISNSAIPIDAGTEVFEGILEFGTAPTVTCTGTCSGGGYDGWLTGGFAGAQAASANLAYKIWPTAAANSLVSDIIQGVVAFNTGTAPTAGTNPPAGSYGADFVAYVPVGDASPGYTVAWPFNNPALTETSILLDGSGNMVRLLGTTFEEAGGPNGPPLLLIADATLTWSGGTAAEKYQTSGGDITFGRWQGGSLDVIDNAAVSPVAPFSINLAQTGSMTGPASSLWLYGTLSAPTLIQSLVGTTTYTMTASTTPFDSLGNTGTLNVAAMTANFTNQVVSATLGLAMNTLVFDVAATMPIGTFDPSGFETTPAYPATITCGTSCTFTYMSAELGGAFAGTTASDAVLGYGIALWDTLTPDVAPASNIISGYVAFNTTTAPTVNPAGPLAAYVATNTSVAYTGAYGGGFDFNFIAAPGEVTPLNNPTTFTENYGGDWGYWGFRTDVLNGANTTTPNTTTANGITFGVWENVASVDVTEQHLKVSGMGGGGMTTPAYMYGAGGYLDSAVVAGTNTGPLSGVFTYTQAAMASYDTSTWVAGTATSATMSANFTNQTVSVGLAGTMGATGWTSTSNGMPITFMNTTFGTGASFNNYVPTITVNAVACSTCGGNISGSFVGQNFAGAIVQYSLWDNNNLDVDGLVAFSRDAAVADLTPVPTGTYVVAESHRLEINPTAITTDGAGVLTGFGATGWNSTVAPAAGSVANTAVGSGSGMINWGLWGEGSVGTTSFSYTPGFAQLHWITAPEPTPVYLAEVLTTTNAVYNFVDGDVTNMFSVPGGVHGTISGTTSLTANFTTQTVAVNLALAVDGNTWAASTTNAPLQYSNGNTLNAFNADSYRPPSQPGYLTVTVNPGTGPIVAGGSLAGQLVGAALDGAILKFNLIGVPAASTEWVQGVAALGAAVANDPATEYRGLLTSISDPMALVPTAYVGGSSNNAARVVMNGSGYLTEFDDGSDRIQYASAGTGAGFVDQGSAVIGGETISWGRWDAGTVVNVQNRVTETWENGIVLTGGAHALVGPLMTGPVALPVSGSYTYNNVGNTLPTDQAGVAGTLNSATLSANFTAQTVNLGVNVTAGGATLNAAATSVPIMQRANFYTDSRMTGAGALAVTCTNGLCGTTNHGGIAGGFGGAGGALAGITYGFEKGGINAGTVSGVVAFQRGAVIP